jgi:hypothetical protein
LNGKGISGFSTQPKNEKEKGDKINMSNKDFNEGDYVE